MVQVVYVGIDTGDKKAAVCLAFLSPLEVVVVVVIGKIANLVPVFSFHFFMLDKARLPSLLSLCQSFKKRSCKILVFLELFLSLRLSLCLRLVDHLHFLTPLSSSSLNT